MTHEELIRSLDRYVDGELSDPERHELEDHLAACSSCQEELRRIGKLLDEAAALRERPIAPAPDLWPGIVRRLNPVPVRAATSRSLWNHRFAGFPMVGWMAAALVVIAVIWAVVNQQPRVNEHDLAAQGSEEPAAGGSVHERVLQPQSGLSQVAVGDVDLTDEITALEAEYGASFIEVSQAAEAVPVTSSESAWAVFEENLSVLDEAIAESKRALESDPGNTGLQRALLYTYRRQLDLLRWAQKVIGQT